MERDRPRSVRDQLLRIPKGSATFHEFAENERLLEMAKADGWVTQLIVMLGGEAGLRCGEMMALEWPDVDLGKRQLSVARSEWKGHVTATKRVRVRHVPLTGRLRDALKQARHLKSPRVLCDAEGQPLTQKEVHNRACTSFDTRSVRTWPREGASAGDSEVGRASRSVYYSALYACKPAALDAAIRLLDNPAARAFGEIEEAAEISPRLAIS